MNQFTKIALSYMQTTRFRL